jgi:hypothetical protein
VFAVLASAPRVLLLAFLCAIRFGQSPDNDLGFTSLRRRCWLAVRFAVVTVAGHVAALFSLDARNAANWYQKYEKQA